MGSLSQAEIVDYWKEQDFQNSARLHLQNWIWNYQLGYILHPQIDIPKNETIRVADIACGNGAWMLDLFRERPNATFDGFDISSSSFPAEEWRPENFKYHVWNAFEELAEDFIGAFDVVHVRTIYTAVVNNKVEPLVDNLIKMLKPGGYLQWDEGDATTISAHTAPNSTTTAEASKTLTLLFRTQTRAIAKLHPDWVYQLPSTLSDRGCKLLAEDKIVPKKELQRAWSDNFLTVFMSSIPFYPEDPVPLPKVEGLPKTISRKSYIELFKKAREECSKGVCINAQNVVLVARKAT